MFGWVQLKVVLVGNIDVISWWPISWLTDMHYDGVDMLYSDNIYIMAPIYDIYIYGPWPLVAEWK